MSKVFFGGSRKLGRLNPAIRARLRNLINNGHRVLIGDANGVDKAVQTFLSEEGYRDVIVYCMDGECRNNVGNWPTHTVESHGRRRDFAYFAMKDAEMSVEADYGFMIWDGESKGTLNNALNLLQQGKSVLLYRSTSREFFQVRSARELEALLAEAPPEVIEYLNRRIKLNDRIESASQSTLKF